MVQRLAIIQIITRKLLMLSKEQVRNNRNKLRVMIKTDVIQNIVENKQTEFSPQRQGSSGKSPTREEVRRMRRKTEELSVFENACRNKDVYINKSFEELFKIQCKLGEGAQSIVKKCIERATSKEFAIKFFRKIDCELINTLKSQYKILRILNHPNIIQASNLFICEQLLEAQLVLDYYPHPQLKQYLDLHGRLEEEEVSDIIGQVLLAVTYMHEKGVCHRDIKPQNILYDSFSREVKLIDFEISKMNRKLEKMEMWSMTGTLYYKAPEMFAGKYCESIDVWSIGITAYELLTGKLPFMKQYLNDTIQDIKNKQPSFPPYLSKFAKDFIQRCLVKNPTKRATAKQALSCPFILQCDNGSVLSSPSPDRLNQSFESRGRAWALTEGDEEDEYIKVSKCYKDDLDQEIGLLFLDSHDIGIRCCQTEEDDELYG